MEKLCLEEKEYKGTVFEYKDIYVKWDEVHFKDCEFKNCKLNNNIEGAFFEDVLFEECNLDYVGFVNCKGSLAIFKGTANYFMLEGCNFTKFRLEECYADGARIKNCKITKKLTLNNTSVAGSALIRCEINEFAICYSNLFRTNFSSVTVGVFKSYDNNFSFAKLDLNVTEKNELETNIFCGANLANFSYPEFDRNYINNSCGTLSIVPEEGSFIAWKKLSSNRIAKLEIPADAKRCSGTGRKCRASKAKVLEITSPNGETKYANGFSLLNSGFEYKVGETVFPTNGFDENRFNECSRGIHFFITREEAKEYFS